MNRGEALVTTRAYSTRLGLSAILTELIPLLFRNRMQHKEAPGGPEASQESGSALQCMRVNPLLRLKGDIHEGIEVVETE